MTPTNMEIQKQLIFFMATLTSASIGRSAMIATLEVYLEEGLFDRVTQIASYWEEALHSLKGVDHVVDIRNLGLVGGIEMSSSNGKIGKRG